MGFKNLRHHAADLSKLFIRFDNWHGFEDVAEWLRIASAIKSVDFDDSEYNDDLGWCGSADIYDSAQDRLLEKFISDLTVFSYVWGSLEAFVDYCYYEDRPERKKYGKIGAACHFIKQYLDTDLTPVGYNAELDRLKAIIASKPEFSDILSRFNLPSHVNFEGAGLYVVYKLRNQFAHGDINFPRPDITTHEPNFDMSLIQISTRIVLFSIQMMFISRIGSECLTEVDWLGYGEEPIELCEVLMAFHLKDPSDYIELS